jgi:hypothetical protein
MVPEIGSEGDKQVEKAVLLAFNIYRGHFTPQTRLPFVAHSLDVLSYLADWGVVDVRLRQSAVLHEILHPACPKVLSFDDVCEQFSTQVARTIRDCTFLYQDDALKSDDPVERAGALKKAKLAIAQYFDGFKDKPLDSLVVAVADHIAHTMSLVNTEPDKARTHYIRAERLFTNMRNRHKEITEQLGLPVWSRMKYHQGIVQQLATQ